MFLEIASWASLFISTSLVLPYTVPYFRTKLQQIKSVPVAVFDATCIQDAHQAHINAIDRSVGQIMAVIGQLLITGWASLNLLGLDAYHSLNALFIGYYLYDTVHLLTKPYAKTYTLYVVHHALAIIIVGSLYLVDIPYVVPLNIMYILLEFSAATVNITNLLIHTYPSSTVVITSSFINVSIYGITRVIVYPIVLSYLAYYVYTTTTSTYSFCICLVPLGLLTVLYFACIYWCMGMVAKHRALKQKLIL